MLKLRSLSSLSESVPSCRACHHATYRQTATGPHGAAAAAAAGDMAHAGGVPPVGGALRAAIARGEWPPL